MKNFHPIGAATCAAALLLPLTYAQDQDQEQQEEQAQHRTEAAKHRHATLESLVGADVQLASDEDNASAEIDDLLIAPDGRLEWAVIGFDGRQTLVPFEKLSWNGEEQRFALSMAASNLKDQPMFDLAQARSEGLADSVATVESHWDVSHRARAREAAGQKNQASIENTKFQPARNAILCGSEIGELQMYGQAEEFGSVADTLVDPKAGRIDFLVVSRGGVVGLGATEYLVPIRALVLCREPVDEGENPEDAPVLLCSDKSAKELESAPEYERPDEEGVLISEANRAEAQHFFGVEDDAKKDEKKKKGENERGERDGK